MFNSDYVAQIKVCSWNVRGLTRDKLDNNVMGSIFAEFDIIILTETWLRKEDELPIEGFVNYNYNRKHINSAAKRGSGGICWYIRNIFKSYVKPVLHHEDNLVWFSVTQNLSSKTRPVALGAVYFPPIGSIYNCDKSYFAMLEQDCLHLMDKFDIIICGDFNARTACLPDFLLEIEGSDGNVIPQSVMAEKQFTGVMTDPRISQDTVANEYGKELLDFCKSLNCRLLNGRAYGDAHTGRFTRVENNHGSVIDYVICDANSFSHVTYFHVMDKMPESDHCSLSFNLNFKCNSENDSLKGENVVKYKWCEGGLEKLNQVLSDESSCHLVQKMYESMENIADVNIVTSSWSQYYISAIKKVCDTVVCKQARTNMYKAQWFDMECKQLRLAILGETCPFSREALSREYKLLKQRKKRQYKSKVLLELDNNCGNSKLFWKTFNNLTSARSKTQINLNPTEICKQLKQFSDIPAQEYFSEESQQEIEQFLHMYDKGFNASHKDIDDMVNILNDNVSIKEIEGAINKLKNGKSPGLDGIPSEIVKYSINAIKHHLQALYNYILSSGVYPDCWCEGLRVAIPKNGNDIRPITIEPIFGKVLETILDNRINFVNEVFEKNDKYNGGFSKGSMVQDNLLTIYGCIQKQMCQGKNLFIAFVDFKKAFNFVNHKVLFYKLIKAGINGRILKLLRNMYGKLKARVKVNQCLYEWIIDKSGTNQGGPLSPNMFKYLLADLRYLGSLQGA